MASDPSARTEVLPLLQKLGVRIGLRFADGIKGAKRRVRRLAGGTIDSKQMVLRVIGKRNKERALPLTKSMLVMFGRDSRFRKR